MVIRMHFIYISFKNAPFSSRKNDYLLILEDIDSYIELLKDKANSNVNKDLFSLIFGMLDTDQLGQG